MFCWHLIIRFIRATLSKLRINTRKTRRAKVSVCLVEGDELMQHPSIPDVKLIIYLEHLFLLSLTLTQSFLSTISLTREQTALVQASIPGLKDHGETVTKTFYANLLRAHPELNNMFNSNTQSNGLSAKSPASVVLTFAANIDEPGKHMSRLERVCSKHCFPRGAAGAV